MEGITISAAGVPRASVAGSRAIRRLSSVCAARSGWLTPTTVHCCRGSLLVGWNLGCVNRHISLAGGLRCALDGYWVMFNGFARALSCMPVDHPRCIRMLSLSSTHCTHPINTIGCVVCVEAGEERIGPGRGWEKPWGGWIDNSDGRCLFFCAFWFCVS